MNNILNNIYKKLNNFSLPNHGHAIHEWGIESIGCGIDVLRAHRKIRTWLMVVTFLWGITN